MAKPAAPTPVAPRGKKILVVDDDAIIRKTTALKLEADGYTVVTATDGPQALNVIRQERPDLILMDINFPSDMGGVVWDGFATMSWLRRTEQGRDLPVIIISGSNVEQWKGRALDAGAVGVFPKPIDHNGLLAAIERTLSGPAAAGNGFQAEFQF